MLFISRIMWPLACYLCMDDYNIHASIMLALRSHSMIFAIDFFYFGDAHMAGRMAYIAWRLAYIGAPTIGVIKYMAVVP